MWRRRVCAHEIQSEAFSKRFFYSPRIHFIQLHIAYSYARSSIRAELCAIPTLAYTHLIFRVECAITMANNQIVAVDVVVVVVPFGAIVAVYGGAQLHAELANVRNVNGC